MSDLLQLLGIQKSQNRKKKQDVARIREDRKNLLTPKSNFFVREAYKTLRSNVSFSLTGDEKSKVIMVTSSLQAEGKSITAINLAISYAQTNRRVLIVDCDLRRPKLARLLQIKNSVGLSNVLMEPSLLDEAILSTGLPDLDVILSGDIPPNPSELLSSPRMARFIEELKQKYDMIILDTPPVNVVIDAVVLSPLTEGVVFLIRANYTERGAVIHAVEQLEYAKAKILGFVLNGVDFGITSYGYDKRHYRRYGRYGYGRYGRYGYGGYGHGYGYSYSSSQHHHSEKSAEQ